jgi:hypothetical protein
MAADQGGLDGPQHAGPSYRPRRPQRNPDPQVVFEIEMFDGELGEALRLEQARAIREVFQWWAAQAAERADGAPGEPTGRRRACCRPPRRHQSDGARTARRGGPAGSVGSAAVGVLRAHLD